MANFVLLLVGIVLVWGLWRATQPRPVFTIRIVDAAPQATDGAVTPAFLERVREVAVDNGISHGTVSGYAHGQLIRLGFSAEITRAGRQQLRNWWATFGWPAPRRSVSRHAR